DLVPPIDFLAKGLWALSYPSNSAPTGGLEALRSWATNMASTPSSTARPSSPRSRRAGTPPVACPSDPGHAPDAGVRGVAFEFRYRTSTTGHPGTMPSVTDRPWRIFAQSTVPGAFTQGF